MSWILSAVIAALLLLAVGVAVWPRRERARDEIDLPLRRTRTLFSPTERGALGLLEQAVGAKYRIFGKVRIADVVRPVASAEPALRHRAWQRLRSRHFDFVLCRPDDLAVVCAVEVDAGRRTTTADRRHAEFVGAVCRAAGLPLMHMPDDERCSVLELRHLLARATSPGGSAGEQQPPDPV